MKAGAYDEAQGKACISEAPKDCGFGKRMRKGRGKGAEGAETASGTLGNGRGGLPA